MTEEILVEDDNDEIIELAQQIQPPSRISNFFKYVGTGVSTYASACTGVADGAEMLRGMNQDHYKNIALLAGASIASGGISAGMTAPTTQESFEEAFILLKQRKFPENWEAMPNDIYYELTNQIKKMLLNACPHLHADLSVEALVEGALGNVNHTLYELCGWLLALRDEWQGGEANEKSYNKIVNLDEDKAGAARVAFYERVIADVAILKEDYPELNDIANTLEKIKHWEAWPKNKKLASALIVSPFVLLAAAFDTSTTYFNAQYLYKEFTWLKKNIPASTFNAVGGLLAAGVALTSLTTEGKESFLGVASYFNERDEVQYSSSASRVVSPFLGYSFALLNAVVETTGDYMAVKEILGLTRKDHLLGCGIAASISNLPSIYFMGGYTFDVLDGLFGYGKQLAYHRHEMSKLGILKDVASAGIALALSSYLNEIVRLNTKVALDTVAEDMRINGRVSDQASSAIMWIMCVYYSITGAAAIYSPTRRLVGGAINKGIGFFKAVNERCSGKHEADVEVRQGLLQNDETEDEVLEEPKRFGCKSACIIL